MPALDAPPPADPLSDDALKLMIARYGVRGSCRLLGLDTRESERVRKRVGRARWCKDPAMASIMPTKSGVLVSPGPSPIVPKLSPVASLASVLASDNRETKMELSAYARDKARHLRELPDDIGLASAPLAVAVTKVASQVHRWQGAGAAGHELAVSLESEGPVRLTVGVRPAQAQQDGWPEERQDGDPLTDC